MPEQRRLSATRMLLVGLLALALGALLNADQLVREADAKPFGRKRDISLAIWEPVQSVSETLYLNRPRRWIDDLRGRYPEQAVLTAESVDAPTTVTTTTAPPAPSTTSPGPAPETSTTTTLVPTTTTTIPRLFVPSPENRLRLWVGGDSMAQVFGDSLVRLASATDLFEATNHSTISSGLTRPDFFDWPSFLSQAIVDEDPDVIVVIFGANDVQGLQTEAGDIYQPSELEWAEEYRSRVSATMDLLMDDQRLVVWVGQPIMRSSGFSQDLELLNSIYSDEAARRDGVEFLDSWDLFVDENGGYTDLLEAADGKVLDLRQNDGVHLTRDGGARLATAVLELIDSVSSS